MKKRITLLVSTLVIGATVLLVLPSMNAQQSGSSTPPKKDPTQEMRTALQHLQQARGFLKLAGESNVEFGGHRKTALKACEEAIKEVNEGLKPAQ